MHQDDKGATIGGGERFSQCLYLYGENVRGELTGISSGDWWCASLHSISVASTVTMFPAGVAERKEKMHA